MSDTAPREQRIRTTKRVRRAPVFPQQSFCLSYSKAGTSMRCIRHILNCSLLRYFLCRAQSRLFPPQGLLSIFRSLPCLRARQQRSTTRSVSDRTFSEVRTYIYCSCCLPSLRNRPCRCNPIGEAEVERALSRGVHLQILSST